MKYFLAIDGGQSRSTAILANDKGKVVGIAHGGPTINFVETGGVAYLQEVLSRLIHNLFENAQLTIHPLEGICLGLTGWWEETPAILRSILQAHQIMSVEDTVIAQAGAFAGGPGIVVISGTGSVAYGKDSLGKEGRSGGWGYAMGDEGSGYDIGCRALRSITQAFDKRGPDTVLVFKIPAFLNQPNLHSLQKAIFDGVVNRRDIASLAIVVAHAASECDQVSLEIMEDRAIELGKLPLSVAGQLSWEDPPISPVGGVFKAGRVFREPFEQEIRLRLPRASIKEPIYPPVIGALILALQAAGVNIDDEVRSCLDQAAIQLT